MVIQIIGADKGVGEAFASHCLAKGHQVGAGLLSLSGNKSNKWKAFETSLCLAQTDVRDENGMREAAQKLADRFGPIDVVVNVAGLLTDGDRNNDIVNVDFAELQLMMEVNAYGVLKAFRCFYPFMRRDGAGLYAAVTAGGGTFLMEDPMFPAYVVSKVTANKLVQTIKNTVSDVRVCAIHPGKVNTDMGRTTAEIEPEESAAGIYDIVAVGRELSSWFVNYDGEPLSI